MLAFSMSSEPVTKRSKMSALDQLKQFSTVVADTGDFEGEFIVLFDFDIIKLNICLYY